MIIWYSFSIGTIATQMYFKYSYTFYLPAGYLKMRFGNIYWRKVTEGKTPRPARVIDVMKISYSNWRANSSTSIDSVAIYKRQFPCTVENEVRKSRLVFGHISPGNYWHWMKHKMIFLSQGVERRSAANTHRSKQLSVLQLSLIICVLF